MPFRQALTTYFALNASNDTSASVGERHRYGQQIHGGSRNLIWCVLLDLTESEATRSRNSVGTLAFRPILAGGSERRLLAPQRLREDWDTIGLWRSQGFLFP